MAPKLPPVKIAVTLTFVLSVQVSCWMVDLAEMNKLNVETEAAENGSDENVRNDLEDVYQSSELEYQSYMEKRIHGVLNNGSIYLDGLRKAMAHYRERLENCSITTTTTESSTWLPENDPSMPSEADTCRSIMAASDEVTKLSELALWATNELRERKFAEKETAQQEEEELLMKLAWFLDQLAQLTGYSPDPNDFEPSTTEASTTPTEEISSTTIPETTTPSLEIMQSVENGPPLQKLKSTKNIKKRSVDNEMANFVKNYIKYKVWNTDNSDVNTKPDSYDVKNEINTKSIKKRAIFVKKAMQLRAPTKKRNLKRKKIYIEKPKRYFFQKQHGGMAVKVIRKAAKPKSLAKRSVYYKDYGISRIPEDPMQDISHYIKNRPGTMYDPSVEQVANVYDSLMKHYNLATFEMIRRFGSNVTLGIDNLTNGAIKTVADAQ